MKLNRRKGKRLLIGILLTIAGVSCQQRTTTVESKTRLNVLFISVDDLLPALGCYGNNVVKSRHIDAIAEQGTVFRRAYTQQAWCAPSRTCLLTGLRPDSTRVYDLETHFRSTTPKAVTLPQYFKQHQYAVTALGKIFHETLDDSLSWSSPAWIPPVEDPLRFYALPANQTMAASGRGYARPTERAEVNDAAYPDGQVADRAIRVLQQAGSQPFFLAVGFYKPHLPFTAPEKYWQLYNPDELPMPTRTRPPDHAPDWGLMKRAEHHNYRGIPPFPNGQPLPDSVTRNLIHGYYACVSYIDAQIGRITQTLKELGLLENTIIVVWGDHGWKLGEYGAWSKHTNYEIDTRVPLIIRVPGMKNQGSHQQALVELLDVYPTLADLAGLPVPSGVQGQSMAPLIRGQSKVGKTSAYSQFIRNANLTHTTNQQATVMGQAVRTERFRLVRWIERSAPYKLLALELYDHVLDPEETVNRASNTNYQNTITELSVLLDKNFTLKPNQ